MPLLPGADAYIMLDPNIAKKTAYNSGKATWGLVADRKQLAQVLYDLSFGDLLTLKQAYAECQTQQERSAFLGDFMLQTGLGLVPDDTPAGLAQTFANGMEAGKKLSELAKKLPSSEVPPEVSVVTKKIAKLQRPSNFTCIVRLRGEKPGETRFSISNQPPGPIIDSNPWWNPFGKKTIRNTTNSTPITNVTNVRGGCQELNTVIINCDRLDNQTSLEKIFDLITKNRKKILIPVLIGSLLYVVFKKRRSLKKFLFSLKKIFSHAHFVYTNIKNNKIINNCVTRRIWIFVPGVNRI